MEKLYLAFVLLLFPALSYPQVLVIYKNDCLPKSRLIADMCAKRWSHDCYDNGPLNPGEQRQALIPADKLVETVGGVMRRNSHILAHCLANSFMYTEGTIYARYYKKDGKYLCDATYTPPDKSKTVTLTCMCQPRQENLN